MAGTLRLKRSGALFALSLGLGAIAGCSSSSSEPEEADASLDGAEEAQQAQEAGTASDASIDSTVADGGTGTDASSPAPDTSASDTEGPDAASQDAHGGDANEPDTNVTDSGAGDAHTADASTPDATTADASTPDASAVDADTADTSTADASTADADTPDARVADGGGFDSSFAHVDVCGAASATLAWTASIPPVHPTLSLVDIAAGPTNDVIVADLSGSATFEQHRWTSAGATVSAHQDQSGAYTGTLWTSGIFADTQNGLFYGMLQTGLPQGANSGVQLVWTRLVPDGGVSFTAALTGAAPMSSGSPSVSFFQVGGDSTENLHGGIVMSPQTIAEGVYCYLYDSTDNGENADNVTRALGPNGALWPTPDNNLAFFQPITASTDYGCSPSLTVPSAGGVALAKFTGRGDCVWNQLLALPTAAIKSSNFRVGADGSFDVAVSYTGTINFGGKVLQSTGTSSLALARFDTNGNLSWSETFGGTGSSFTVGSLAVNSTGLMVLTGRYGGSVDLGGGSLPPSNDTVIATFDSLGALKWAKTVTVGAEGGLVAAAGPCGPVLATNSPSVNLGTGPLSSAGSGQPASIGVAAIAW